MLSLSLIRTSRLRALERDHDALLGVRAEAALERECRMSAEDMLRLLLERLLPARPKRPPPYPPYAGCACPPAGPLA